MCDGAEARVRLYHPSIEARRNMLDGVAVFFQGKRIPRDRIAVRAGFLEFSHRFVADRPGLGFFVGEWHAVMDDRTQTANVSSACAAAGLPVENCACSLPEAGPPRIQRGATPQLTCRRIFTDDPLTKTSIRDAPRIEVLSPPRADFEEQVGKDSCTPTTVQWKAFSRTPKGDAMEANARVFVDGSVVSESTFGANDFLWSSQLDRQKARTLELRVSNSCGTRRYKRVLDELLHTATIVSNPTKMLVSDAPVRLSVSVGCSITNGPVDVLLSSSPPLFQKTTLTINAGERETFVDLALKPEVVDFDGGQVTFSAAGPRIKPTTAALSIERPRGFADFHNHGFANLGFGGGVVVGDPRTVPGTGGLGCDPRHAQIYIISDLLAAIFYAPGVAVKNILDVQMLADGEPHSMVPIGPPNFEGLTAGTWTHTTVDRTTLKRALDGGMRLVVFLAVNQEAACHASPLRRFSCSNDEAVFRQVDAAIDLEREIDRACGTPGCGWFRIAYTASQARAIINGGKLAVVLGVEVDRMFDTAPNYSLGLEQYWTRGVRHYFPIHFTQNEFGGQAKSHALTENGDVVKCDDPQLEYPRALIKGATQTVCGKGLTSFGRNFIRMLMDRGAVIDVDHMSDRSLKDTIAVARTREYPLFSSHTGLLEVAQGDKLHEGNMSATEVAQIMETGGAFAVITNQGSKLSETRTQADLTTSPKCPLTVETFLQPVAALALKYRVRGIGIGTDFSGGIGQPGGRCSKATSEPVVYPFVAPSGTLLSKPTIGSRELDINQDGLVHIGMLPDFIVDLGNAAEASGVNRNAIIDPIMNGADAYVRGWERAERSAERARTGRSTAATARTPQSDGNDDSGARRRR